MDRKEFLREGVGEGVGEAEAILGAASVLASAMSENAVDMVIKVCEDKRVVFGIEDAREWRCVDMTTVDVGICWGTV